MTTATARSAIMKRACSHSGHDLAYRFGSGNRHPLNVEPDDGRTRAVVTSHKSGTNTSTLALNTSAHASMPNFSTAKPNTAGHLSQNQYGDPRRRCEGRTFWFVAYEGCGRTGTAGHAAFHRSQDQCLPCHATTPPPPRRRGIGARPPIVINPVIALLRAIPGAFRCRRRRYRRTTHSAVPDHLPSRRQPDPENRTPGRRDSADLLTDGISMAAATELSAGAGRRTTVPTSTPDSDARPGAVAFLHHLITSKLLLEVGAAGTGLPKAFSSDSNFNPASSVSTPALPTSGFGLPQISFGDGTSGLGGTIPARHRFDTTGSTSPSRLNTGKHNFKFAMNTGAHTVNQFYDLAIGRLKFALRRFSGGHHANGGSQFSGDSQRPPTEQRRLLFPGQLPPDAQLSLNYGVRWDYFGVIYEDGNRFSLFNPATLRWRWWARERSESLYPRDLNNLLPLHAAYDLSAQAAR